MKKILLILLLLTGQFNAFSQRFNVDNKDSCTAFLCKKPWVANAINKSGYPTDSIINMITFYKNGTYLKKISELNAEAYLRKPEKGFWSYNGNATGKWIENGDSVNYEIEIMMEIKSSSGTTGYGMRLVDFSKFKNTNKKVRVDFETLFPRFPCLQNDGQKVRGLYYKQN